MPRQEQEEVAAAAAAAAAVFFFCLQVCAITDPAHHSHDWLATLQKHGEKTVGVRRADTDHSQKAGKVVRHATPSTSQDNQLGGFTLHLHATSGGGGGGGGGGGNGEMF